MQLNKKHFFTLIGINSVLPVFLVLFRGINKESWVILIVCAMVAIASFVLFFISWVSYFIVTAGREPSWNFHLVPQFLISASIFIFFSYSIYSDWRYKNYEMNIIYNKDFLNSNGFSSYDSLYGSAFKKLENKFENKNDIRLHSFTTTAFDTTSTKIHDSLRILYFIYQVKGNSEEFGSKHLIGHKTNKLLLYNIPVSFLPELKKAKRTTLKEEENGLTRLLLYYKSLPAKEKDEEMIKIVESELERIKQEKF